MTETFANNNVSPNLIIGGNTTLTAASGIDPAGQGWLRLTNKVGQSGYCYINKNIPSGLGVLAEFEFKAWSTSYDPNADGFSMFLFDASYGPGTFTIGSPGGALGYWGLSGAYVGIGLDEFGNNSGAWTAGDALAPGFTSQAITVRAPTSQNNVYLAGTGAYLGNTTLAGTALSFGYSASRPTDDVYYRKVRITVAPVGPLYQIIVALQTSPSGTMTNVLTTTTATPPPANLKIGFAASTGSYWANHEIRNLTVTTPGGVRAEKTGPQLFKNGDDVSYKVKVYNDGLTPQTGIAFTDSLPAGFQFSSIAFDNAGNAGNTFDVSAGSVVNNVYSNSSLGLKVGSYSIFTINGKMILTDSTTKQMRNTAIAKSPGGVIDPDLINDTSRFTSYRVPFVNNKDITICGGNNISLPLATMAGAQLNWTVSSTGSVSGAVAGTGNADASGKFTLNQTVTNTGTTPAQVTYTITPSYVHTLADGSTLIATGTPVASTVTVNPRATAADIILTGASTCFNSSTTLTATSSTVANAVFKWYADAALTQLLYTGATFITPALTTNTSYFVTIENASSCQNLPGTAKQVNVTVNAIPAPPVVSPNVAVCEGALLKLSTTALTGFSYTWIWGAGKYAVGPDAPITTQASAADAMTYYVIGTEAGTGCTSANSVNVTVKPLPAAPTITWTAVCEGSDQLLTASSSTSGVTYTWASSVPLTVNNDKATIKAATVSNNGTYTAYANFNGCTSAAGTANVQIKPMPAVPVITWTAVCDGSDQLLKASSSTAGVTYNWTGAKLLIVNDQAIIRSATIADNGVYKVSASLNGCTSAVGTANVQMKPIPAVPTISWTPVCDGFDQVLTASSVTNGVTYNWDGVKPLIANNNQATIKAATTADNGTYSVSSTLNGCTSQPATVDVVIRPAPGAPAASYNGGQGSICQGADLSLWAASPTAGVGYSWTGPNSFTSNQATPTIKSASLSAAGHYLVAATLNGCSSKTTDLMVIINNNVSVSVDKKDVTCQGGSDGSIVLTPVAGLAPYTYKWNNGSNQQAIANLPSGKYDAIITDANGCYANTSLLIVNDGAAPPQPPVADNFETCETTGSVTLSAEGTNLQWYGSGGTLLSSAPRISKSTPNAYSYYVSSKDALGCESGKTLITALIKPVPSITAVNKQEPNCNGYAKGSFEVLVEGGCKNTGYTFSLLSTTQTQSGSTFTDIAPGNYTVQATDACGCSVTQSVVMTVKMLDCDLQLPNAFTPNGDNKNDIFRPASWGIVSDYKLQIYNRQGQLVFQSTRPEDGWNGSIRGMMQAEGTYIWLLNYKNASGEVRNLKGTVVLLK